MNSVRVFGYSKRDREFVKDFPSLEDAVRWARENDATIHAHLNASGLEKMKDGRAAEDAEWQLFADACFQYVRGTRP